MGAFKWLLGFTEVPKVEEGRGRDKRTPKIEEIMAKIFQNLMQTVNLQIQETQQNPKCKKH